MDRHPITGCRHESMLGFWSIDPGQFEQMVAIAVDVDLHKVASDHKVKMEAEAKDVADGKKKAPELPYTMAGNVAVMDITGPTTKYETSFSGLFGGTSTVRTQAGLRHAARNPDVEAVMLRIDSPGGTVSGAFDLASEIKKTDLIKPVYGHGEDQCTSAAQLFLSQCRYSTANENAVLGSIGVRSELRDTSKRMDKDGIRVIPITAGKYKAIGAPGAPVSDADIHEAERRVNELNDVFVDRVSAGRGMTKESIRAMEARTYVGNKAKDLGLVDSICTFDEALSAVQSKSVRIPANRGPGGSPKLPVASRSSAMAKFTAEQLIQARGLPGAANITEENAESVVLQSALSLQTELAVAKATISQQSTVVEELKLKAPKAIDPVLLEGRLEIANGKIDLAVGKGLVTTAQSVAIKAGLLLDGKANPVMFTPMANGKMPYDTLLSTLELNKPNGLNKDLSGAQPAGRTEPGQEGEKTVADKATSDATDFIKNRRKSQGELK